MSARVPANPQAFPIFLSDGNVREWGMSLRDYFAAHAMSAIYRQSEDDQWVEVAKSAYRIADAMLTEMEQADIYAQAANRLAAAMARVLGQVKVQDLEALPQDHLARVLPIVKDWRDQEFEAIEQMKADLAALLARKPEEPS